MPFPGPVENPVNGAVVHLSAEVWTHLDGSTWASVERSESVEGPVLGYASTMLPDVDGKLLATVDLGALLRMITAGLEGKLPL